jgi:hypothetical protein
MASWSAESLGDLFSGLGVHRNPQPAPTPIRNVPPRNAAAPPRARTHRSIADEIIRKGGDLWGAAADAFGDGVRHASQFADNFGQATSNEVALTGGYWQPTGGPGGQFVPVPEGARSGFARLDPHTISKQVAPTAASIVRYGRAQLPVNPTKVDLQFQAVGHAAPAVAATLIDPLAGAMYGGVDGYGRAYEDALAHNASEDMARWAGAQEMLVQGALGATPIPVAKAAAPFVRQIAHPFAQLGARVAIRAGAGALFGAESQIGSNVVAQHNYDPQRRWYDGVPEAATQAGVISAVLGAPLEGVRTLKGARTNVPQREIAEPAGNPKEIPRPPVATRVAPWDDPNRTEWPEGAFHIIDWTGYEQDSQRPDWPIWHVEGDEYEDGRTEGDRYTKREARARAIVGTGVHLHHRQPIKWGGPPSEPRNIEPLDNAVHYRMNAWWKKLGRDVGWK